MGAPVAAADIKVGQNYIIEVINKTGGTISWIKRQETGGYNVLLLGNEGIQLQRRTSRVDWIEAKDEYAKLFDDPDNLHKQRTGQIFAGKNTMRKWKPINPGNYRIRFNYSLPDGTKYAAFSEAFQVNPE